MSEVAKKVVDMPEADGFFYFNPNGDVESGLSDDYYDIALLKKNLGRQKRRLFVSYIVLVLINFLTMAYWLTKSTQIAINEAKDYDCDNTNGCSRSSISFLIKALIITHSLWTLNFVLGCVLLKWKFNFGLSVYFSALILVFFARTTLNIFIMIAQKKLNVLLEGSFDTVAYLAVVTFQTLGDILLLVLTIKMRRATQKVDNLEDERLLASSLLKMKVYTPKAEKGVRGL